MAFLRIAAPVNRKSIAEAVQDNNTAAPQTGFLGLASQEILSRNSVLPD